MTVFAASLGSLIEVVNRFGSFFYGSLLGVFILALTVRRATGLGAFVGLLAGMTAVAIFAFHPATKDVSFLWQNPLGAFVVWASRRHIPETHDPTITGRLDLAGSALATIGLGGVTFALIQTPDHGIGSPTVVTALAFSPDGLRLVVGYSDGLLRLFDPRTGQELARFVLVLVATLFLSLSAGMFASAAARSRRRG